MPALRISDYSKECRQALLDSVEVYPAEHLCHACHRHWFSALSSKFYCTALVLEVVQLMISWQKHLEIQRQHQRRWKHSILSCRFGLGYFWLAEVQEHVASPVPSPSQDVIGEVLHLDLVELRVFHVSS